MGQRGLWNIANKRMLEDGGSLPREDGDLLREYQAMHEENFLSNWLREGVECTEEERKRLKEEAQQEKKVKSGKSEVEEKGKDFELEGKCLDRMSDEFFGNFSLISEVECGRVPLGFRCGCLPCSSLCLM